MICFSSLMVRSSELRAFSRENNTLQLRHSRKIKRLWRRGQRFPRRSVPAGRLQLVFFDRDPTRKTRFKMQRTARSPPLTILETLAPYLLNDILDNRGTVEIKLQLPLAIN